MSTAWPTAASKRWCKAEATVRATKWNRIRCSHPLPRRPQSKKSSRRARNFGQDGVLVREMPRCFPRDALGFSSICNLEKFREIGLFKIENRALNGGRGNAECGFRNAE